ncbi:hypothetical protein PLESTB_000025700 [Pleodorina starrii]|uniref:Uncharacterized protein n=1 Tax=Pleodorina starrii TaxID=330485 RepID=A0A9W6EWB5_9CHLO|nr:hypothetical protein PLESTB_000025700 [Pleodorina starrii]
MVARPGFSFGIGMGADGHMRPTGHSHQNQRHHQPPQPQPRESISSGKPLRGGTNPAASSASSASSSPLSSTSASSSSSSSQRLGSNIGGPGASGGGGSSSGATVTSLSGGGAGSGAGAGGPRGGSSVLRGGGGSGSAVLGGAAAAAAAGGGGGGMALRRGMAAFWATYNASLAERPLFTKCVTGVVGTVLGDLIAQLSSHALSSTPTEGGTAFAADPPRLSQLRHHGSGGGGGGGEEDEYTAGKGKDHDRLKEGGGRRFKYDVQRVLRLCLWSVMIGTPLAHYWFRFLDTRVMPHAPTSNSAVVTKLLLDQLLMSPAGTAFFFFGFRLLEGGSLAEARSSVSSKWAPTMALNYVLWPAANIINFKFVPPEQRILYVNCVALFWSAVMSHMANRKEPHAATGAAGVALGAGGGDGTALKATAADASHGAGVLSARARGLAAAAEPAGTVGEAGPYMPLRGSEGRRRE